MSLEWIGWAATALFGASYFFKEPRQLRIVQAVAAFAWIAYGAIIGAAPVIVANVIVATLALLSARKDDRPAQPPRSPAEPA